MGILITAVVGLLVFAWLLLLTMGTFKVLCWIFPSLFVGGVFVSNPPLFASALAIMVMAVIPFYITYRMCRWLL